MWSAATSLPPAALGVTLALRSFLGASRSSRLSLGRRRRGHRHFRRQRGANSSEPAAQPLKRHTGQLVVNPAPGCGHACTLIYLHGYSRSAEEYMPNGQLSFCMPWVPGGDRARGLRAVLPRASVQKQPWGEAENSWYQYAKPNRNDVGNASSLTETRRRLRRVIEGEIRRLGLAGHGRDASRRVFLGGGSQGCVTALDAYLRYGTRFRLGGFVGSVGFMPSDDYGFDGATRALQELLRDEEQASRPVWLQCATDDHVYVPWKGLVKPSLRRASGQLPGLRVREVFGRGHGVEEWESHIVNDFIRAYASDAYSLR